MYKNFYLRPSGINLIKSNIENKIKKPFYNNIKFSNIDVLRINKKNNLEIEKMININKFINNNDSNILNKKYPELQTRINKILKKNKLNKLFPKNKIVIMGVLNVTQDSFYDGGKYFEYKEALKHAKRLIDQGADIIDIGGESSRPGATPIEPEDEIKKVIPLIKELSKNNVLISCDTRNAKTMKAALDAGASIINDVSGLSYDKNTLDVIKDYNCTYILMHSKGTPDNMQNNPFYKNVTCDIYNFFENKILTLIKKNISMQNLIIDPGIGYGKTDNHNFEILENLSIFLDLGVPLLIGVSRKSLIQRFINDNKYKALASSVSLGINAYFKGANILRVHDVKETIDSINLFHRVGI